MKLAKQKLKQSVSSQPSDQKILESLSKPSILWGCGAIESNQT